MTSRGGSSVRVDLFGGFDVSAGQSARRFSPYQTALISIVFAEGVISRKRLAAILWEREIDGHVRHSLRQLIHAVRAHVKILPDRWTVVTKDHKLSAQWEHTLMVTPSGAEVFTARGEESFQ